MEENVSGCFFLNTVYFAKYNIHSLLLPQHIVIIINTFDIKKLVTSQTVVDIHDQYMFPTFLD